MRSCLVLKSSLSSCSALHFQFFCSWLNCRDKRSVNSRADTPIGFWRKIARACVIEKGGRLNCSVHYHCIRKRCVMIIYLLNTGDKNTRVAYSYIETQAFILMNEIMVWQGDFQCTTSGAISANKSIPHQMAILLQPLPPATNYYTFITSLDNLYTCH